MKNLIKIIGESREYMISAIDENNRRKFDYSNSLVNELDHKMCNQINNLN